MRAFLFKAVTQTSAALIGLVGVLNNLSLSIIGSVAYALMRLIDRDKLSAYEKLVEAHQNPESELSSQAMELRLLASANQVRDHARETGDWTDRHTEALNAIGDALMLEAEWQEESVHQYLKGLVESIDGLEYGTED